MTSNPSSSDQRYLRFAESVAAARADGVEPDLDALGAELGLSAEEVQEWLGRVDRTVALFAGAMGPEPDLAQPQLPDDYVLEEELGRGGMGIVYRVTQTSLDRPLALKVLRPGDLMLRDAVQRFRREARSLARLKHPHIVPVHEVGQIDAHIYFTMDLVDGESLARRLSRGDLTVAVSVKVAQQVASAIAHAHSRGVIHRDLKPANILIDQDEDAHVVDFGLALDATQDGSFTATGRLLGTPAYMSPEQARGDTSVVGERSDVYALGTVLYECLTGSAPFPQRYFGDLIHAVIHQEPARVRALNPAVPRDLDRICSQAMAKHPERRYATMEAFLRDLQAFEEGRPVQARDPGLAYRTTRWLARNQRAVMAGGMATVLLAVAMVLSFLYVSRLAPEMLMKQAQQLRAKGRVEEAQRLTDLAKSLTVVARPDGTAFLAVDEEFLIRKADEIEQAIALQQQGEPEGNERLRRLSVELDEWNQHHDISNSTSVEEGHWLRARALYAVGERDEASGDLSGNPFAAAHQHTRVRVEAWVRRAFLTAGHPERESAAAMILASRVWGSGKPFSPALVVSEHPELLREFVLEALAGRELHDELNLRGLLGLLKSLSTSIEQSALLPLLAEQAADTLLADTRRSTAAGLLARLANLPAAPIGFSWRSSDGSSPVDRNRILQQYQAVQHLPWTDGLRKRLQLAAGGAPRVHEHWLLQTIGKGSKPFDDQRDELRQFLAKAAGIKGKIPELKVLLRQYRGPGSGRKRGALRHLITCIAVEDSDAAPPPYSLPLVDEAMPWAIIEGEGPRTVRIAELEVSSGTTHPELIWSEALSVGRGEEVTFGHGFKVHQAWSAAHHGPGFGHHLRKSVTHTTSGRLRVERVGNWLQVQVPDLVRSRPGSSGWGPGKALNDGFVGVLDYSPEPTLLSPNFPNSPHLVMLVASGPPDDGRVWSIEDWRQRLIACVREHAASIAGLDLRGSNIHALRGSIIEELRAATYLAIPEARASLAELAGFFGRNSSRAIQPARLLAGDPSPLDDHDWVASVAVESQSAGDQGFGGRGEFHTAFLARLVTQAHEPRIRRFALDQMADRELASSTREALGNWANQQPDLGEDGARIRDLLRSDYKGQGPYSGVLPPALWVAALTLVGLLAVLGSWRATVRSSTAAVVAGLGLHAYQLEISGITVTPQLGALALLLLGSSGLARSPRCPVNWWPFASVVVATLLWSAEQLTEPSGVGLASSAFLALAFVGIGIQHRVGANTLSSVRVMALLLYGVPVFVGYGNWIWSWVAFGDAAPSIPLFRELTPWVWFGSLALAIQLVTRPGSWSAFRGRHLTIRQAIGHIRRGGV